MKHGKWNKRNSQINAATSRFCRRTMLKEEEWTHEIRMSLSDRLYAMWRGRKGMMKTKTHSRGKGSIRMRTRRRTKHITRLRQLPWLHAIGLYPLQLLYLSCESSVPFRDYSKGNALDVDFPLFGATGLLSQSCEPLLEVISTRPSISRFTIIVLYAYADENTSVYKDERTYREKVLDVRMLNLRLKEVVLVQEKDLRNIIQHIKRKEEGVIRLKSTWTIVNDILSPILSWRLAFGSAWYWVELCERRWEMLTASLSSTKHWS